MYKRVATTVSIVALAIISNAGAQAPPAPTITDSEFDALMALVDEAHGNLVRHISGMSDEQWAFHENPDRWSVGQCVEHIARSERAMLANIQGLIQSDPDPDWQSKTANKLPILKQLVPNPLPQGQGGVRAPEELVPTENWNRRTGIQEVYNVHGEVRAFIETMDRDIKDRTMESTIPQFGWMNAHDWLYMLPLHVMRHTKQIAKVQADPNYPTREPIVRDAENSPIVSDEEFGWLVADIDRGQETLLGLITGMTEEQWNFQENPDRWSTGGCVEHIVKGEHAVLDGINNMAQLPPNANWYEETKGKYEMLREAVVTRPKGGVGSPFKSPYEIAPSENWDRATAIREFFKSHGRLRAFAETMDRDVKQITFENPFPQLGMLNAFDWMTLMALHVNRHSMQIGEILADANYPK